MVAQDEKTRIVAPVKILLRNHLLEFPLDRRRVTNLPASDSAGVDVIPFPDTLLVSEYGTCLREF
jgi:hypothetical protein